MQECFLCPQWSEGALVGLERGALSGAARLVLADGVALLQPEESVLSAMLEGWGRQQRSRLLGAAAVRSRVAMVRRFGGFTGEHPWRWTSGDVEEWTSSLLSGPSPLAHSTIRGYHVALRLFCDYATDARYGWGEECDRRFDVRPVQVCHKWNTAEHLSEFEGRPGNRAFTLEELQTLFDVMDAAVEAVRRRGRKGMVAALRDAALFKVAYGWGLRRRECAIRSDDASRREEQRGGTIRGILFAGFGPLPLQGPSGINSARLVTFVSPIRWEGRTEDHRWTLQASGPYHCSSRG